MALVLTAPAQATGDTIIATLTNDENLIGEAASDFTLRRADTNAVIRSDISLSQIRSQGGLFRWEITARNLEFYSGAAYVQMAALSARELQSFSRVPPNALNSNQFTFQLPPSVPSSLMARVVDGNTIELMFGASQGTVTQYQYRFGLTLQALMAAEWVEGGTATTITVGELESDTLYYFQVRSANQELYSAASNTISARTLKVLEIEAIDKQLIPVQRRYELSIRIKGGPTDVEAKGLQEGFFQSWDPDAGANFGILKIASELTTRLIEDAIWVIEISAGAVSVMADILYSVVPVAPVFVDPGRLTIYKGVPFELLVEVQNAPDVARAESPLVGAKFTNETIDEKDYVKSAGKLPSDAVVLFSEYIAAYYAENSGGVDRLNVTVDIRTDAVEPVFAGLSNVSVASGAGVNITFTVTATPPNPEVILKAGAPDWVSLEYVSGNSYRLSGNPTEGVYMVTVVARGLNEPEQTITITVTAPVMIVAPTIRTIGTISRTEGYSSRITGTATLSSGTLPVTWSISGISGATISQNGVYSIPARLSQGTHTATITARNDAGSDTENVRVVVDTLRAPSGTITLMITYENGIMSLSWNHPSDRGNPVATYSLPFNRYRNGELAQNSSFGSGLTQNRLRIPGATSGDEYRVRVRATNSQGRISSDLVSFTIP